MVELALPKNSQVKSGKHWPAPAGAKKVKTFKIYRYDPEAGGNPRWDTYDVDMDAVGPMVLVPESGVACAGRTSKSRAIALARNVFKVLYGG